ncbi:DUF4870 domain-containing protein [Streptomyces sp. NPDC021093]|uniref:DUF4870 domain-containing protein n=1 Tax=Streptomyces sp. NPDC021093 TaxID=3365112 RepID=UPI0037B524AD
MTTPPPAQPPQDPNGGYGYPSAGGPYGYPQGAPGQQSPYGHPQGAPGQQPPYGAPGPGPYSGPYPGPYDYGHGMPPQQFSTTSAMWAHLGTLLALTLGSGVTCGLSAIAAWVVGLSIRSSARDPFTRVHGTAALNLALTSLIYSAGMVGLSLLLSFLPGNVAALQVVPMVLLIVYGITVVVFMIIATVAANKGRPYRYPAFLAFPMAKS